VSEYIGGVDYVLSWLVNNLTSVGLHAPRIIFHLLTFNFIYCCTIVLS